MARQQGEILAPEVEEGFAETYRAIDGISYILSRWAINTLRKLMQSCNKSYTKDRTFGEYEEHG